MHILFVCTGNICRSPMAERLAAAIATRFAISNFTSSSAGTRAVVSSPMHSEAALVLNRLGAEPLNFRARQLKSRIVLDADLVLVMTRAHRESVLELAPHRMSRTFLLTEAAALAVKPEVFSIDDLSNFRSQLSPADLSDIQDPIGRSSEVFANVGSQISALLPPILELCWRHRS